MTVFSYAVGILFGHISNPGGKKAALVFALVLLLGILCLFKYTDFTITNIHAILGDRFTWNPSFSLVLPVGISFYTFQIVSYVIDVYRGDVKSEKNFVTYALYVSFFPQLVAGPIELSNKFLKQFTERHYFDYLRVKQGLVTMLWGYFMKLVIADRAAKIVDNVYGNIEQHSGAVLVLATVLFAIQLYCDFAGYSTIALGAAKVLGFTMTDNFHAPFLATSVADLWRRWHISLNTWFKNYLYIPLGGSKKGTARKYFNTMLVFTLSGLWHGANWTFVIWGALNGAYQIMGGITGKARGKLAHAMCIDRLSAKRAGAVAVHIWKNCCVFILFATTMVFFRASGIKDAFLVYKNIFTDFWVHSGVESIFSLGCGQKSFVVLILAILLLFVVDLYKYMGKNIWINVTEKHLAIQWSVYILMVNIILLFGVYGADSASFIYFVF